MLKLLIVDDEAIIRRGIHYYIDWGAHGIEVIGEAANGQEGLQMVSQKQPDIVVTDIRMPVMDGIEMARQLKALYPQIHVIILTGYNENEYLHSAIRVGITDFILKSAKPAEIVKGVLRCKEKILEEQENKNRMSKELVESNFRLFHHELLHELLMMGKSEAELLTFSHQLGVELNGPQYLPFVLTLKNKQLLDEVQLTLLIQLEAYLPFLAQDKGEMIAGLLNLTEACNPDRVFEPTLQKLRQAQLGGAKLLAGQTTPTLKAASAELNRLYRLIPSLCWNEEYSLMVAQADQEKTALPLEQLLTMESRIIKAFVQQNAEEYLSAVSSYRDELRRQRLDLIQVKESMKRMITSMYNNLNSYERASVYLERINAAQTVTEAFEALQDVMREHYISTPQSKIVRTALAYISEHYAANISVQDIAAACYVTPSYLSRLFKAETGTGILQYLHQYRMEQAKKMLLNTDLRITEIAALTGYADYKRCSFYFLRLVGMSPREYKNLNRRSDKQGLARNE